MPTIDLDKVIERCFSDPCIRKRICGDFGIKDSGTAQDLASKLVKQFDQIPPKGHSWENHLDNCRVFRAAVFAIGSNSRNWATFLKYECRLKEILFGYDPAAVRERLRSGRSIEEDIKKCLPGQTVSKDSEAILDWAELLGDSPSYYDCLVKLRRKMAALPQVTENEAVPMVAGVLGMDLEKINKRWSPPDGLRTWKAPRMGFPLACEFLRNLYWGTFKPDRHIQRLLGCWFWEGTADAEERAKELGKVIGSQSKGLIKPLQFSLLGMKVSPADRHINAVDNLVWVLAAYVEKKDRESKTNYVTE